MIRLAAQNIGKAFRVYPKPSDRLWEALLRRPRHQEVRVLKKIDFEIPAGRSLGIVGDNGAGKTTLLKIISGTLSPTEGTVTVNGRVAALLELGAGFHPEFTGRRNIYLNASLMGLTEADIRDREAAIIEFSGLSDFIDRPVKTYSSGMYVRLAFSVATAVDPDILVIDEALAVGDIAFQRKCIRRMNAFRENGKTMIFCSHSMYHVRELCESAIWLDGGRVWRFGETERVVSEYEDARYHNSAATTEKVAMRQPAGDDCRIREVALEAPDGKPTTTIRPLSEAVFRMTVDVLDRATPQFGFALMTPEETYALCGLTHHDGISVGTFSAGDRVTVRLRIPSFPLRQGTYRLVGGVSDESGLLFYAYTDCGWIRVEAPLGFGLVTAERSWQIDRDAAGEPTEGIRI